MKTIKRIKKIVKMGVVLSIAAIALSVYSASSASALEAGPSLDEDIMIEFDDFIFDEELIPLFGTDVDIEASGCLPHWMGPEGINITVTNNNDGPKHYEVFVYNGVVEIEETPEFTFPEEDTWSDSELLFSEDTFEFQYRGTFDTPSAAVLRVKITEGPLVLLIDVEDDVIVEADVIFDEEIIVCEYDAEQMLSEAAEEYEAAEALAEAEAAAAEAQAQAEAAAQAQAEAEAQATAEAEELEAELADAEEAAAEAQAALDSMIEAVSVDIESDSQETPSSNESTETASQNQPLVDGEQAIGDSLPENTDNSGLPIAMIIVVTLIGLLGLAAAGTAALNMNR
tara:strand:- start:1848 stop:2870 length:1023 start_codon:yes stop_codon:yes gene_type:complete